MDEKLLKKFEGVEKKHWWWEGRRRLIEQFIPHIKNLMVLDVGCGTGETLTFIKSIRPDSQLYGIDTLPLAVKYTKRKTKVNAKLGNANKLRFKKNTFDLILYLDVLEHIKDHAQALNEAKRVLKKNGLIIITAPALPFIASEFDEKQSHERRYTKKDINYLQKKTNLKLEFCSYFNFIFSIPIITIRLLSNIRMFKFLSSYDRGFNYEIAHKSFMNNILKNIFLFEIKKIQYLRYPFGISIIAVFIK